MLAACSPVQLGAAAIVGNQRITVSSLDSQVSYLQAAAKPYGSGIQLTSAEMPSAVLSWLVRFAIMDQLASSSGISVTQSQVQAGTADIDSQASSAASQDGSGTAQSVLISAGIAPQMMPAIGRYQAQELLYVEKVNGGKLPTTTAQNNAVEAAITKGQCAAAKALNIQISPQFGRLDYTQYAVVTSADTLSRLPGVPSPASTTGLAPAC